MKLRVVLLILLVALVLAAPAAAKQHEPTGERISLYFEVQDFPENEPFYIAHGWQVGTGEDFPYPVGLWRFRLEVDGQLQAADFVQRSVDTSTTPPQHTLLWVHNFPGGMTGEHTFTGYWLATCQYLVDQGIIPGPCDDPDEVMTAATRTASVTFLP